MVDQLNSIIDSLSLDHKRGASEIVRDAAELFVQISLMGIENPTGADNVFNRAVRRLARGQPTMAPVLNLLNRLCFIREKMVGNWRDLEAGISEFYSTPTDFVEVMRSHLAALPVANRLIAFSNSSTVAQMIIDCNRQHGWPQQIYCGEGRPVMEGLVLTRKLANAGLDVTLFTDAALMSRVTEIDAVWVGGDSLSREGLVNKVGSRALAILCDHQEKPFISLMSSDKLLPTGLIAYSYSLPQNPREIGGDEAESLNVHNEYYETIPIEFVTMILTEAGVARPGDLISTIENEPVSQLFIRLIAR